MMRLVTFSLFIAFLATSCHGLAIASRAIGTRGLARSLTTQGLKRGLKSQRKPKKRGNQLQNLNRAQDLLELAENASAGDEEKKRYQSAAELDRELRARGIDTRGFKYGPVGPTGARVIYGTPDLSPTGATMTYPNR